MIITLIMPISAHEYKHHDKWLTPPSDLKHIGNSHGEVALDKSGRIYISVYEGKHSGVQVYNSEGKYLHNVKNAPTDLHGFLIREEQGKEYIYGAQLYSESVVKMTIDGEIVLKIEKNKIPTKYHKKKGKRNLTLSSVAVGPEGDIYVVDGYGLDYIHRFDKTGKYLSTFGGRNDKYKLSNCHKIYIDKRYNPARLLCTNRNKGTLVHMSLDGEMIGVHASNLRKPSAVDFYKGQLAVAEINGRLSILDENGKLIKTLSFNDAKYNGNKTKPESWKSGIVTSPHGIAFDKNGNLILTEYSLYGRVLRFDRSEISK